MTDLWTQQLERDLNWREAELASMKLVLLDAAKGSIKQRALLRAGWALLYAHYEGFTKFAWDLYLETLEHKGLARSEVCETLAAFSLSKRFRHLKSSMSTQEVWRFFIHGFPQEMGQPLTFDTRLETHSNLWPDVFRTNNERIGLACEQISIDELKIKSLVGRRNAIAHGEKLEIKDFQEYQTYEECVLLVLHDLAISIVDNLSTNAYLWSP